MKTRATEQKLHDKIQRECDFLSLKIDSSRSIDPTAPVAEAPNEGKAVKAA
jgi:hypothetical protein